jgi:hypothetical protein
MHDGGRAPIISAAIIPRCAIPMQFHVLTCVSFGMLATHANNGFLVRVHARIELIPDTRRFMLCNRHRYVPGHARRGHPAQSLRLERPHRPCPAPCILEGRILDETRVASELLPCRCAAHVLAPPAAMR